MVVNAVECAERITAIDDERARLKKERDDNMLYIQELLGCANGITADDFTRDFVWTTKGPRIRRKRPDDSPRGGQ
jgi:hypothetical protein